MINIENNRLVWKTSGETVVIEPWGENALRVRSVMMGEILETDYALLPPKEQSCVIEAGKDQAKITNGTWRPAGGVRITDASRFLDRMGRCFSVILTMRIPQPPIPESSSQEETGRRA